MQAVGAAVDDADLVVQALDETQGDLIFGFAVGGKPQCTVPHVPQTVFSPPHERDEPRLRVTKQTLHGLQGAKTGEPICIRQAAGSACFRHPSIMPKSRTPAANILCCKKSFQHR